MAAAAAEAEAAGVSRMPPQMMAGFPHEMYQQVGWFGSGAPMAVVQQSGSCLEVGVVRHMRCHTTCPLQPAQGGWLVPHLTDLRVHAAPAPHTRERSSAWLPWRATLRSG